MLDGVSSLGDMGNIVSSVLVKPTKRHAALSPYVGIQVVFSVEAPKSRARACSELCRA
jgi:hypothetical protein